MLICHLSQWQAEEQIDCRSLLFEQKGLLPIIYFPFRDSSSTDDDDELEGPRTYMLINEEECIRAKVQNLALNFGLWRR